MKGFHRLHALRMENDAKRFEMDEQRPRFERMANRKENGTAPRAVTAYQLFQTPPDLAARLVSLLALTGGERILEPSAGLGRLLNALAPYQPRQIVAVEIATQLAGELYQQERESVQLIQCDFLKLDPADFAQFDAVAMNPPFHMRDDIRHVQHALKFLRPGGKLAAVVMNTAKRQAEIRPIASQWIDVAPGTFRQEGTDVPTAMVLIEKGGV